MKRIRRFAGRVIAVIDIVAAARDADLARLMVAFDDLVSR